MKDMLMFLAGIVIVGLVLVSTTNVFPSRGGSSSAMELTVGKDGQTCTLSGKTSGFGMATNVVSTSGVPILVCQGALAKPSSQEDVAGVVNCGSHGTGTVLIAEANQFTVKCIGS